MKYINHAALVALALTTGSISCKEEEKSPILTGKAELIAYLKKEGLTPLKEIPQKFYHAHTLSLECGSPYGLGGMGGIVDEDFVVLLQKLRPTHKKGIISALVSFIFKGSQDHYQVTLQKEDKTFFFGLFKKRVNRNIIITNDPEGFAEKK